MNNSPLIPPALLQKLGQAYRSMPELDLALFSILKGIQTNIQCASISIWLLNEPGTQLECMHTVGTQASNMLGDAMHARKFIRAYRTATNKKSDFGNIPPAECLDSKPQLSSFNLPVNHIHTTPP